MNILSVYAHHEPSSFTAVLKNTAVSILTTQGHQVVESDLYGTGFSPKAEKFDFNSYSGNHFNYMLEQKFTSEHEMGFAPDIMAEINKIKACDLLIIHTPIWWLSVPALLKGWFDRVLAMGVVWDSGHIYEKGLLRGKQAMICGIAGGPKDFYQPDGRHQATIEQILHPVQWGTLAFCGFDILEPFIVYNSLGMDEASRLQTIAEYKFRVEHLQDSPIYFFKHTS